MPEECRENCQEHTGQEERIKSVGGKMTLVLWLLGILISTILGSSVALYTSIQSLNFAIAGMSGRFSSIEAKLTILEATDTRITDRITELERNRK